MVNLFWKYIKKILHGNNGRQSTKNIACSNSVETCEKIGFLGVKVVSSVLKHSVYIFNFYNNIFKVCNET